jgi:glycosyltransferase involved in cell wall biosynthesis
MFKRLRDDVKAGQIDIVHDHGLWMMPNVYTSWAVRESACCLVMSPHGMLSEWALSQSPWIKKAFWTLIQGRSTRRATCIHATAESEYEDVRRMGLCQPVCVIPHGIDVPDAARKPKGPKRQLLFLGRVHPKKGVDILLHAWHGIAHRFPDWMLRIAGPDNGGYLTHMQALARGANIERVEFCGPLYGEDKLRAYQEAELFVLPTHSENFAITVTEAMAAGTPVIVTRGAPWSALECRGAGWWIDIGLEPLRACLEVAMSRPSAELTAMGERARLWMLRDFSWRHVGKTLDDVYHWLLGGGDKPSCVRID